ncbi:MAG: hypothetical protein LBS20_11500 [Prevotella sp.]|jgi:hypothetical protein|nr:hypothetical protein [Prevotella sp.]
MHTIIEEHYAHRIEVNIKCSNPNADLSQIPFPVYTLIVNHLADNTRKGIFEDEDCNEYLDDKDKAYYSGTWRILEPISQIE